MKLCKRIYWEGRSEYTFILTHSIAHLWIQLKLHADSASYGEFVYVKENCAELIIPGDRVFITHLQLQHVLHKEVKNMMESLLYTRAPLGRKISRFSLLGPPVLWEGGKRRNDKRKRKETWVY